MRNVILILSMLALLALAPACNHDNGDNTGCDPSIDVVTLGHALPPCPPEPCHGHGCKD